MRRQFLIFFSIITVGSLVAQENYKTYCNFIDIDHTYMVYNSHQDLSYRSGADPVVVEFQDEYYMFVTRSMGYWHSKDLNNWEFIEPQKWYFEGSNAPAAFNYKDSLLYVMGNPSGSMSPIYSNSPKKGDWKAVSGILNNLQDPALFIDDDDQAYLYWGSSNRHPNKLYNSWWVYRENELELKSLSVEQSYYFAIEAFNENGISRRSKPFKGE